MQLTCSSSQTVSEGQSREQVGYRGTHIHWSTDWIHFLLGSQTHSGTSLPNLPWRRRFAKTRINNTLNPYLCLELSQKCTTKILDSTYVSGWRPTLLERPRRTRQQEWQRSSFHRTVSGFTVTFWLKSVHQNPGTAVQGNRLFAPPPIASW